MSKRKTTILIIDDEEDFCLFVRKNLELAGNYKVIVATTSEKGIWSARQGKPDLILLDIMMPGIDGLQALKRLKEDSETRTIPVVVLTAKGDDETKEQAISLHCEGYAVKPAKTEVLISKIENILSKSARESKRNENGKQ